MRTLSASDNVGMGRSEEQARRNEEMFKQANEQIAERRSELTELDGSTPYLCECEEETCTEIVRLTLEEYERVRAGGSRFVIATGHPTRGKPTGVEGDGWLSVEKD